MEDIASFDVQAWLTKRRAQRKAQQAAKNRRIWKQWMRELDAKDRAKANCRHTQTQIIARRDTEYCGMAIEGPVQEVCIDLCGRVLREVV